MNIENDQNKLKEYKIILDKFEEENIDEEYIDEEYIYNFDKYSNEYYKYYKFINRELLDSLYYVKSSYFKKSDYSKLYYYYLKYKTSQVLEIEESSLYTTLNIDWNDGCDICCNNYLMNKEVNCYVHMYSHFFVPGTPSYLIHKQLDTINENNENKSICYYINSNKELYTKYIKINNKIGLIKLGDLYNIYTINRIYNLSKEIKAVFIEKNKYLVNDIENLFT